MRKILFLLFISFVSTDLQAGMNCPLWITALAKRFGYKSAVWEAYPDLLPYKSTFEKLNWKRRTEYHPSSIGGFSRSKFWVGTPNKRNDFSVSYRFIKPDTYVNSWPQPTSRFGNFTFIFAPALGEKIISDLIQEGYLKPTEPVLEDSSHSLIDDRYHFIVIEKPDEIHMTISDGKDAPDRETFFREIIFIIERALAHPLNEQ
ncbi:MAG: hypothetical protein JWQ35_299 [Bacteriovoracaceae bacterium]|nr:hypothetical protein [Bacteriovoracaceae bacterium]